MVGRGAGALKIDLSLPPLLPGHGYLSSLKSSPNGRNKCNLFRRWKAMPRLQRSLVVAVAVLCTFSFSVYLLANVDFAEENFLSGRAKKLSQFGRIPPVVEVPRATIDGRVEFPPPKNDRQRAVVDAFKHAWNGYKKFAWGHDHLMPISGSYDDWFGLGLTIVDSLDTMLLMNLWEEFNQSRDWVENNLNFDKDIFVNLFETTIRVLGGLLSAYHLNGRDQLFLDKAKALGYKLVVAFDTPTKIPYSDVNLKTGQAKMPSWTIDGSLAEIGSLQLEFRELSRLTGDPLFENLAFNVSARLHDMGCTKFDGLCPMFISPKKGEWRGGSTITMGARTDSFYEYLLKQWLQTNKKIDWLQTDYLSAIEGTVKHLIRRSEPNKLTFVGELLNEKTFSPKMDHLVCFLPGTLSLGAYHKLPHHEQHLDLAKNLAHTCNQMYNKTKTGLSPEIVHFNLVPKIQPVTSDHLNSVGEEKLSDGSDDIFIKSADAHALLRPEAVEAWFYLYWITGDSMYQDWGWDFFQALQKHAKTSHAYASVRNVKNSPVSHMDKMESFFLAETLKYLYLLFDDDRNLLPLDRFIFNTEAHPFPIRNFQ